MHFPKDYIFKYILLLAAPLGGVAGMQAQVNAEQVLTIGKNVLSMEDYLLSIQYFNLAIKAKPYLADPYFYRGIAKLSLDDYEGAIADCNLALERNKYKSEAYKVRGFAYMNTGRDSLAIEDFKHGLEYNPDDRYFLFYKGIAETELKRYERADSTFGYLLRRYPNFEDAYLANGRKELLRGDTVRAIENIDKALHLSKSLVNAYLLKAEIAARKSDWTEALANMDEAIRLRPDETDYYINRAYLRYNDEDFFGAMSDYNYSLQLEPDNTAALFNRALLRSQVKELSNAEKDFSKVLDLEPSNFYALYNRGLIRLELEQYRDALTDFRKIAQQYPKFHPVYYAMAECYRQMGNLRLMADNIKTADRLVSNYVANPTKNPLDRPVISAGRNSTRHNGDTPETDEEFMVRFNQLQTNSNVDEQQLAFNDRIKGRVQDRNFNIAPQQPYFISFNPPEKSLRNITNYFRDLENLNRRQYIGRKFYLRSDSPMPSDQLSINNSFGIEEEFNNVISRSATPRPIDYFGRGVARVMLKNYDDAIIDLTKAIEGADDFISAYFARANAYYLKGISGNTSLPKDDKANDVPMLMPETSAIDFRMSLADLDQVITLAPNMPYAWFNKGMIYYQLQDYTSAIQCFSEAINIDPEFGEAYFNRGLSFLHQGNREKAFTDLSKAGESGVLTSYNLLKRIK